MDPENDARGGPASKRPRIQPSPLDTPPHTTPVKHPFGDAPSVATSDDTEAAAGSSGGTRGEEASLRCAETGEAQEEAGACVETSIQPGGMDPATRGVDESERNTNTTRGDVCAPGPPEENPSAMAVDSTPRGAVAAVVAPASRNCAPGPLLFRRCEVTDGFYDPSADGGAGFRQGSARRELDTDAAGPRGGWDLVDLTPALSDPDGVEENDDLGASTLTASPANPETPMALDIGAQPRAEDGPDGASALVGHSVMAAEIGAALSGGVLVDDPSPTEWVLGPENTFEETKVVVTPVDPGGGELPTAVPWTADVAWHPESGKVMIFPVDDRTAAALVEESHPEWQNVWWALATLRKHRVAVAISVVWNTHLAVAAAEGGMDRAASEADDGARALDVEVSLEGWRLKEGQRCIPPGLEGLSQKEALTAAYAAIVLFSRMRPGGDAECARAGADLDELYYATHTTTVAVQEPSPDTASVQNAGRCTLAGCSDDILVCVFQWCLATTLRKLAQVCRRFYRLLRVPTGSGGHFSLSLIPGMQLPRLKRRGDGGHITSELAPKLLPHQLVAIRRMMTMEKEMAVEDEFAFVKVAVLAGPEEPQALYVHRISGKIQSRPPQRCRVGRGGLLSDDPGMGKTVTALGLMLATVGVRSRPPPSAAEIAERRRVAAQAVWAGLAPSDQYAIVVGFCKSVVARLDNSGLEGDDKNVFSYSMTSKFLPPPWSTVLKSPPVRDAAGEFLRRSLGTDDLKDGSYRELRGSSASSLQHSALRLFQGWVDLHRAASAVPPPLQTRLERIAVVAERMQGALDGLLRDTEKRLLSRGRRRRSADAAALHSDALVHQGLLSSCASLVVVPWQLVDQWASKAKEVTAQYHSIAPSVPRRGAPVLVEDEGAPQGHQNRRWRYGYFDEPNGTGQLPPATELRECWIVVISSKRLATADLDPLSPLRRINWLRMLVDEGDTLATGTHTAKNSLLISSEARWVISGTPTPQIQNQSGINRLQKLLPYAGRFEPFDYDSDPDRKNFRTLFRDPYGTELVPRRHDAVVALLRLLQYAMIRSARKGADITGMFEPIVETRELTLGPSERYVYNSSLAMFQSNVLLTGMAMHHHQCEAGRLSEPYDKEKDGMWRESYLNLKANWETRSTTSKDKAGTSTLFSQMQRLASGCDAVATHTAPTDRMEAARFLAVSRSFADYSVESLEPPDEDRIAKAMRMMLSESIRGKVVKLSTEYHVYVRASWPVPNPRFQVAAVVRRLLKAHSAEAEQIMCDTNPAHGLVWGGHILKDSTGQYEGLLCCEQCVRAGFTKSSNLSIAVSSEYFGRGAAATAVKGSSATNSRRFDTRPSRATCFHIVGGSRCGEPALNGWGRCGRHQSDALRAVAMGNTMRHPTATDRATRFMEGLHDVCDNCGDELPGLCISGCGHLLCTECVVPESTECPVANCTFVIDAEQFTFMQPSFQLKFEENLQCPSCGVDFGAYPHKRDRKKRKVIDVGKLTHNQKQKLHVHRSCQWWQHGGLPQSSQGKLNYLVTEILRLWNDPEQNRTFKAIVFSQTPRLLEYAGDKLVRAYIAQKIKEKQVELSKKTGLSVSADEVRIPEKECYRFLADQRGGADGVTADGEIRKFRSDPECKVLLIGTDRTKGLDLSFATHMFILDEVFDTATRDQLFARTYRLGAAGPATVIRLVAKGTVDEVLHNINEAEKTSRSMSLSQKLSKARDPMLKKQKTLNVMKQLKFLRGKESEEVKASVGEPEMPGFANMELDPIQEDDADEPVNSGRELTNESVHSLSAQPNAQSISTKESFVSEAVVCSVEPTSRTAVNMDEEMAVESRRNSGRGSTEESVHSPPTQHHAQNTSTEEAFVPRAAASTDRWNDIRTLITKTLTSSSERTITEVLSALREPKLGVNIVEDLCFLLKDDLKALSDVSLTLVEKGRLAELGKRIKKKFTKRVKFQQVDDD